MKRQIHPVVAGLIIVVFLGVIGLLFWNHSQGINTGPGKLKSDMKLTEMDPEKFKQGVAELLRKEREQKERR